MVLSQGYSTCRILLGEETHAKETVSMVFNLLRNYRVFFIYQENIINIYEGFLQIYTQLFIYILKRNCIFFFASS